MMCERGATMHDAHKPWIHLGPSQCEFLCCSCAAPRGKKSAYGYGAFHRAVIMNLRPRGRAHLGYHLAVSSWVKKQILDVVAQGTSESVKAYG